jgi:predicted metal-dependent hydrolase
VQRPGDYQKQKAEALALVLARIEHYESALGVSCNAVRIKNQKSCWGSCSQKGNININYNILHLPPELQEYIIVHELCHLKEFNHSKQFWEHVASVIPEHKELRKRLRKVRLSYRD